MVLRLWLNMLDGMVALAAGKASPRGELFNELPDRISDFVLFSGLAHSGFAIGGLAYWAGGAALFVAYVGTFGQALGVGRQFGGVMSKQWRMVALCVGCLFAFAVGDRTGSWAGLAVFDWCLIAVLLGCVQTVWVRLGAIVRGLDLAQNSTGASGS
jgi:phosphatidylglycerophosphate synthase